MWAGSWQGMSPLVRTRKVREVIAAGDGDGICEADDVLILPVVLTLTPSEGVHVGLVIAKYHWVRRWARM